MNYKIMYWMEGEPAESIDIECSVIPLKGIGLTVAGYVVEGLRASGFSVTIREEKCEWIETRTDCTDPCVLAAVPGEKGAE